MKRLLVLGLVALSSCGPTNVNIPPGAVVVQALTDPSPAPAAQASPTPSPTPTPTPAPTAAPSPTPTPSPSACPFGWTQAHPGGGCLSPIQSPVATQANAINACAAMSVTLVQQGHNAAVLCDTAPLMNGPIQQNTYLWTSVQESGGEPILYIDGPSGSASTWGLGSISPPLPSSFPYYCCSAPN